MSKRSCSIVKAGFKVTTLLTVVRCENITPVKMPLIGGWIGTGRRCSREISTLLRISLVQQQILFAYSSSERHIPGPWR